MHHMPINRRQFAREATAVAGLALSSQSFAQTRTSANDRIRMGFIGVGEMGSADLSDMMRTGQIDVVAIADPYQPHLDEALGTTSGKAKGYKDFRHILDDKNIDAVCIATPEHWHAIPMIMACDAGKDVYVEKPLSHTIHEGRRMVEKVLEERDFRSVRAEEIAKLVRETGALDRAAKMAKEYVRRAKASLEVLPDTEYRRALLAVPDFILEREN
jgi:hypothetical protein